MTAVTRRCRSCLSEDLVLALDLGPQAASDHFPSVDDPFPDPVWPLSLWSCSCCGLAQLGGGAAPVPEAPLAVESSTMLAHARRSAVAVAARLDLGPGSTVVEFDSHHGGSWSPGLLGAGLRVPPEEERADLVVDVHALPHEEDLEAALRLRVDRLGSGGRLVLEFHHLLPMVVQGQFDTVRHGHPLYLSLHALVPALQRHGLHPLSAQTAAVYGGSLVVTAAADGEADPSVAAVLAAEEEAGVHRPAGLAVLQERARHSAEALSTWVRQAVADGRRVLAYGAPSKASVLLTCSGIGPDLLPFTADLSPAKHGRRIPGAGVPIRSPGELLAARPDDVLVLTWDIAEEVAAQLPEIVRHGGRFVVPVPEPFVLDAGVTPGGRRRAAL